MSGFLVELNFGDDARFKEFLRMAAQKPRTGDGPMEIVPEPRGLYTLRIPADGGGRVQVVMDKTELEELQQKLKPIVAAKK